MLKSRLTKFSYCLKTIQLFLMALVVFDSASANEASLVKKLTSRAPANFVADDDISPLPLERKSWTQQILVEDDAGVLKGIKEDLDRWQSIDSYAKSWNLKSTGLYDTPGTAKRQAYLQKMILKYADKRLSGEVRKAEEGSTLHAVGQAQKALKPNAEANITQNIKIKFKARILQGKAIMKIENPYVQYETSANLSGEVNIDASRDFEYLGLKTSLNYRADEDKLRLNFARKFEDLDVQANINYEVSNESWTASLEKPLYKKLIGRVSSTQSDKKMLLGTGSNQVMEVLFHSPF